MSRATTTKETKKTTPPPQVPAVKANNLPTEAYEQNWGTEGTDSRDILIPKLLIMQGLSKMVTEDKAQMGDFVDSVTGELLGSGREKALQDVNFIPIMTFKTWVEYEKIEVKGKEPKLEFKRIIPMDETNANWELEEDKDGITIRRDRCINFYVLLANKTDDLPYLITFRRTSYRAGQKLATHFKKCELAALRGKPVPPAATIFKLSASKMTNEKGTFYVVDVTPSEPTPKESLKMAWDWFQMLKASNVKVDHSDLTGEVEPETEIIEDDGKEMDKRF
jgi:hypothetical protein